MGGVSVSNKGCLFGAWGQCQGTCIVFLREDAVFMFIRTRLRDPWSKKRQFLEISSGNRVKNTICLVGNRFFLEVEEV